MAWPAGGIADDRIAWSDLGRELDRWYRAGRVASMWWRDDDAAAPGPSLDRLVSIARDHAVTIGLAVIPSRACDSLAPWLESAEAEVLQHGWAHHSHAMAGEKKSELGTHRAAAVVLAELSRGGARLRALAGDRSLPVLVPPWNRIDPMLVPVLPYAMFRGLSTFGPRCTITPAPGLTQLNCHADIVDWRGGRKFIGDHRAIAAVVGHLVARRTRTADPTEPTGLLTHHRVHEAATWTFVARFIAWTRAHPAVRWLAPSEALFD